ncbi:hypothetical protein [Amycolatopsis arida]|nr:hypothetical protein [Amycolatopsis arida]
MPIPELVRQVQAGRAEDWYTGSGTAQELAGAHEEASTRLRKVLTGLESVWTGAGADAGRAKLQPMVEVTDAASQAYDGNARVATEGASGFEEMKRSLVPMPERPPTRDFLDHASPWETDTEERIRQYRAVEEQNLQRYQAYDQQTQAAGSGLARDYGQLGAFDGEVTLDTSPASDTGTDGRRDPGQPRTPAGSAWAPPPSPRHQPDIPTQPGTPAPASGDGGGTSTRPGADESTHTSRVVPPAAHQPSWSPPGGSQPTPPPGPGPTGGPPGTGTYTSPYPPGRTSGIGASPGGRSGGGPLSGGRSAGVGGPAGPGAPRGGGAPAPGKLTGAAPGGGPTPAGTAPGTRPGAGGGRAGMPMGGMAPAAGGGGKSSDSDHQRKYVQPSDEHFVLVTDGEKLRDPETGMAVTPPTLGRP